MEKVVSKDGAEIAYDRLGVGPALVLVAGAMATRADAAASAKSLAPYFTVFAYDRRGRGDSGDRLPYALEREIEDLQAVIAAAGGSAFVFGHSSGAILALEATRLIAPSITKMALYEPPFIVNDGTPPLPEDYVTRLQELASAGRRGDTVKYWMTTVIGVPDAAQAQCKANRCGSRSRRWRPRWSTTPRSRPRM